MKSIMFTAIIALSAFVSFKASADEIIFETCPGNYVRGFHGSARPLTYSLYSDDGGEWQCQDRDALIQALTGTSAMLGIISATCGAFPEPVLTKIAVPVFGLPGAAIGTLAWLVSGIDCEKPLTESQKLQVRREACDALDMALDEDTGKCIKL